MCKIKRLIMNVSGEFLTFGGQERSQFVRIGPAKVLKITFL